MLLMCYSTPQDATKLEEEYEVVSEQLNEKYNATRGVKERADALRDRAATLYQEIYRKKEDLDGMTNLVLRKYQIFNIIDINIVFKYYD